MREGWQERPLGEVADVTMGQSPPGNSYNETGEGLPFIQGSAEFGAHHPTPVRWCSDPRKVARVGDVLLSVRAPVGDTNVADAPIAIGRGLAIIRGVDEFATTPFMRLALENNVSQLLSRSGGGMFTSITGAALRALPVTIPPLAEQRRIVDLIGALDDTIAAAEEAKLAAEYALDQAANHAVASATGDDAQLGDVLTVVRGGSPRPINAFYTTSDDGLPWIRIGDVSPDGKYITSTEKKILKEGLSKTRTVEPGDFLLSNSMSFGRPYIVRVDGCIHDGWLRLSDFEGSLTEDYLYFLLRSTTVQAQFRSLAAGSSVQNLNKDKVASVRVTVPSIARQQEIAAQLDAFRGTIDRLATTASTLQSLRSNLLTALLSGEHEIPESYDELMDGAA